MSWPDTQVTHGSKRSGCLWVSNPQETPQAGREQNPDGKHAPEPGGRGEKGGETGTGEREGREGGGGGEGRRGGRGIGRGRGQKRHRHPARPPAGDPPTRGGGGSETVKRGGGSESIRRRTSKPATPEISNSIQKPGPPESG